MGEWGSCRRYLPAYRYPGEDFPHNYLGMVVSIAQATFPLMQVQFPSRKQLNTILTSLPDLGASLGASVVTPLPCLARRKAGLD